MSASASQSDSGRSKQSQSLLSVLVDRLEKIDIVDTGTTDRIDREFKANLARACRGMSPLEIAGAYFDWISHLAISPGKQLELAQSFIRKSVSLGLYGARSLLDPALKGPASRLERRVSSENWKRWPFNVVAQAHQLSKDWWNEATSGVSGVSDSRQALVNFMAQQVLDTLSPANYLVTNPDVIKTTIDERGRNLGRGIRNLVKDQYGKLTNGDSPSIGEFKVGENLGITEGKVVFQNELIEMIQYTPKTETVGAQPVLIVPAWIMKYYILDLSPKNSMTKYLVEQGKTVFMMSWKNPDKDDRDVGFEDYLLKGLMAALDAVSAICPKRKINAVGYCIGGTLLSIGAAAMARDGDDRLNSVTLFAAQTDFSEAGEITRFVSPSQLEFLDKLMWREGLLRSSNMGGAFSALRVSDLVYGSSVDRYLRGNEPAKIDLMAWNADGTRMSYRMHTEYLHKLFLDNEFARNKFRVGGDVVSMSDVRAPMFVLGTETDHVAPWKSVYKINDIARTDITFALTSGGHNAGVVSGPRHPRRRYRMQTRQVGDRYVDPDRWINENEAHEGSWWPAWNDWLDQQMSSQIKPPRMGAARKGFKVLRDAPGKYVFG